MRFLSVISNKNLLLPFTIHYNVFTFSSFQDETSLGFNKSNLSTKLDVYRKNSIKVLTEFR